VPFMRLHGSVGIFSGFWRYRSLKTLSANLNNTAQRFCVDNERCESAFTHWTARPNQITTPLPSVGLLKPGPC
jgi:hypothetical protein